MSEEDLTAGANLGVVPPPQSPKGAERLVFLPLGGSGEIGMNMNLYGYGAPGREKWIMIDCGVLFGNARTPGVDLIFPDPRFIVEQVDKLAAIVLTHAHEDHIGAIAHLWPYMQVPMYATPFTAKMMASKFAEKGIRADEYLRILPLRKTFAVGPFSLEFVTLNHSIPEMSAVMIRTPAAKVFHTGDWKIDEDPVIGQPGDWDRLRQLGEEGVDAVVCDSTNALDEGRSGSEGALIPNLRAVIAGARRRAIITGFASNVARLKGIMTACHQAGRRYVFCGRSMDKVFSIGREMGYFANLPEPIRPQDASNLAPDKVAYICTGSQGEERSALYRIADGRHPDVDLAPGDTVIFSSKIIPGNERSVFDLMNLLAVKGVQMITAKHADIHVSGHPARDELRDLYAALRPRIVVPVHGEMMHMQAHARLAESCGAKHTHVPRNGDLIELAPRPAHLCARVHNGRLYADGNVIDDADRGATAERIRLSEAGIVTVSFCLDARGHALAASPSIFVSGIPDLTAVTEVGTQKFIYDAVMQAFAEAEAPVRGEPRRLAEHVRKFLRNVLLRAWGKRPLIEVESVRVGAKMAAGDALKINAPVGARRSYGGGGRRPQQERPQHDRHQQSDRPRHERTPQPATVSTSGSTSGAPTDAAPLETGEEGAPQAARRRRRRRRAPRRDDASGGVKSTPSDASVVLPDGEQV